MVDRPIIRTALERPDGASTGHQSTSSSRERLLQHRRSDGEQAEASTSGQPTERLLRHRQSDERMAAATQLLSIEARRADLQAVYDGNPSLQFDPAWAKRQ